MNNLTPSPAKNSQISPLRLWCSQLLALIWKELQIIVRDPSTWLIAVILPLIFLLLFGYGISLDAGILQMAVINPSGGEKSLQIASSFAYSPSFATNNVKDIAEAGRQLRDSEIQGIIVFREDFDQKLDAGSQGDLQIIIDGSEPNTAQFIKIYSQGVVSNWQTTSLPGGEIMEPAIDQQNRFWFNPSAKSENFLVPGSITVIMTLIGTLLTSLVFSREWERGTMEALFSAPISRLQILLGKLIPYYLLGMASMVFCVVLGIYLFNVPFLGSAGAMFFLSTIFLLSALGQGLLISASIKIQLVAAEAGMFSGLLPALLLSGFVFDIESMPLIIRGLTQLLPATYFNICIRTLFLTGDNWDVFWPCVIKMLILAMIFLGLAYKKLVKRLDV